jgi:HEAT repeat protein
LAVSLSSPAQTPDGNRKPLSEPFAEGEMTKQYFGSDRTVRLLGEIARNGIDPLERERAVMDLGQTGNPGALALLKQALSDKDRRVRSAAALALCNSTATEAAGLLAGALKRPDSSKEDLAGALRAARSVRWPALTEALINLLKHPAPIVRANALDALTEQPKAADAKTLGELLADSNIAVRLAAARNAALAKPDSLLAEALAKVAKDDVPAVRGLCLAALGRHASKKEEYLLLLTLGGSNDNPLLRRGAVDGFTSAGKGEKIAAFLNDDSTPVRLAAVRGVGKLKRTECIDRLFKIMLDTPPFETHLAARDSLAQMGVPKTTAAKAGRLMEKNAPEYFRLLSRQKSKIPKEERLQLNRRVKKTRRNLKALSYLLGAAKSTQAYKTHLDLLKDVHVQDSLIEQLALSTEQIGDRRAIGPMVKRLTDCANFSERALKLMAGNPEIKISLPEDGASGLIRACVAMKVSEALPIIMRFSSMGFAEYRAKRSAWTADMLMPVLADEQTRPAVIAELRKQINWNYAAGGSEADSSKYRKAQSRKHTSLRCRFESAKSLGRMKANESVEDLRWVITEYRMDRRVMHAAAWAIQKITGRTPAVTLPKPRHGDWIIKER